jgi:hypothetical protein
MRAFFRTTHRWHNFSHCFRSWNLLLCSDQLYPRPERFCLRSRSSSSRPQSLGPGFSVTFGAVLINASLSLWKGHNREILLAAAIMMSKFSSLLVISTARLTAFLHSRIWRCSRRSYSRQRRPGSGSNHHRGFRCQWCARPRRHHSDYGLSRRPNRHLCRTIPFDPYHRRLYRLRDLL